MKGLVVVLTSLIIVIAVVFTIVVTGGVYNVAATSPHGDFEAWILNKVKRSSIRARADEVSVTIPRDSASYQRGLTSFRQMCVGCHGAPGQDRGWVGQGMTPTPPDLADAAAQFSEAELYWIIANGVKMAGMPALAPTHSEQEVAEIVTFVRSLPGMSNSEYALLVQRQDRPDTTAVPDDHHGHTHEH